MVPEVIEGLEGLKPLIGIQIMNDCSGNLLGPSTLSGYWVEYHN